MKTSTVPIIIIAVVSILLVGFILYRFNVIGHNYDKYNLDVKAFTEKYQSTPNAVLLDVRTADEIKEEGKIEGAQQLDFYRQDFHQKVDSLDKTKEYFVYCRGGGRSGETCEYLAKRGCQCHSLKGGYNAWKKEHK